MNCSVSASLGVFACVAVVGAGTALPTRVHVQAARITTEPAPGPVQTPAQQQYGLPRNPRVGDPVSEDLGIPLTLQRAIGIGLQRQNSIAVTRAQADAASERLAQARADFYPTITPTFAFNTNLRPGGAINVGGNIIQGSNYQETRNEAINLNYTLLDTGQRDARLGQNRRSFFATEFGVGDQRQAVILNVTENYYNLLRNRDLVRVQEANVRRAETTLESIRAQVAVGNAAQADTLQAEADLANARVNQLSAQNDARVTEASLKNAMGIATSDPLVLAEEPLPPISTEPGSEGLDNYVQLAYDYRLDLKQQQERVFAQGYNVRLARINAGPTFAATIQQGYALNPVPGEQRFFSASLSYPLFDAGQVRAALAESRANLEAERRNLDLQEQNVRLSVEQAFTTRELSRQRIAASQIAVRAAQLNYDAALERQRNGVINILDVVTAQTQLVNAQVQLVQGQYDYYIADARLQRAIGLNDPQYTPRVPNARQPRVTRIGKGKQSGIAQVPRFAPKKVVEEAQARLERAAMPDNAETNKADNKQ